MSIDVRSATAGEFETKRNDIDKNESQKVVEKQTISLEGAPMLVEGMACFQLSSSDLLSHRAVIIVERCFGRLLRCFGQNVFDFLNITTLCNLVSVDTCWYIYYVLFFCGKTQYCV